MWIEVILVVSTHDVLDHHGHLLILQLEINCFEIAPGIGRINGGVNQLNGITQLLEANPEIGMVIRDQIGFKDS